MKKLVLLISLVMAMAAVPASAFGADTVSAPAAPGKIVAKTASVDSVKLTWGKVSGASGYIVYRYAKKGTKAIFVKDVKNKRTYTDTALKKNTKYYYKVRAYVNKNGTKSAGKLSSYQIGVAGVLKQRITSLSSNLNKVTVNWKKMTGAAGYIIYQSTAKKGKYKKIKTVRKPSIISFTKTELKAGKTYYYKVRAFKTINKKNLYGPLSNPKVIKATYAKPKCTGATVYKEGKSDKVTVQIYNNKYSAALNVKNISGAIMNGNQKVTGLKVTSYKASKNGKSKKTGKEIVIPAGKTYYINCTLNKKIVYKTSYKARLYVKYKEHNYSLMFYSANYLKTK